MYLSPDAKPVEKHLSGGLKGQKTFFNEHLNHFVANQVVFSEHIPISHQSRALRASTCNSLFLSLLLLLLLLLSPSELGIGAQKLQLYLHTLFIKEAFVMGLAHVIFPSPPSPPQSRPERERDSPTDRQTALPLENEKVGGGYY